VGGFVWFSLQSVGDLRMGLESKPDSDLVMKDVLLDKEIEGLSTADEIIVELQKEIEDDKISASPDGKYVAFLDQSGQVSLWTIGEEQPEILPDVEVVDYGNSIWSPDSRYLFIDNGTWTVRSLLIIDVAEKKPVDVICYHEVFILSPDCRYLAFATPSEFAPVVELDPNPTHLAIYNLANRETKVVVWASSEYSLSPLGWDNEGLHYLKYYYWEDAREYFTYQLTNSDVVKVQSPDGLNTAEISCNEAKDRVLLLRRQGKQDEILEITPAGSLASIEKFCWLDNQTLILKDHINPSLGIYTVIDAVAKKVAGNYYGTTFTWNKQRDKLYYLEGMPHPNYLDGHQKIRDGAGNLCFETGAGEVICGQLYISADDKYFAFYLENVEEGQMELVVAQMEQGERLRRIWGKECPLGKVRFLDDSLLEVVISLEQKETHNFQTEG